MLGAQFYNCSLELANKIGMSKIGKKIIEIPEGISFIQENNELIFKNKTDELRVPVLSGIKPIIEGNILRFEILDKSKQTRSNWGTIASLSINTIEGLVKGFSKKLILEGVGFNMAKEGEGLKLNLGFSHQVEYKAVPGISFELEKNTILIVRGIDKALVGQVAAKIRALKKPEPYKGKGFHYEGEVVRRKAGKKVGSTTA